MRAPGLWQETVYSVHVARRVVDSWIGGPSDRGMPSIVRGLSVKRRSRLTAEVQESLSNSDCVGLPAANVVDQLRKSTVES